MSIYQELKAAGIPLDNHESDLYAKVTPASQAIVDRYKFKCNVTKFQSQIPAEKGQVWFDIPFAFDPFWEKAGTRAPLNPKVNTH